MNRRKAIKHVALLIGGSIVGTNLFLEGCVRSTNKKIAILFEKDSINLLNELGEAILPRTSTPGAKDANVGSFIPVMIRDCYSEVNQKAFVDGLGEIDRRSKLEFGKKFLELTSDERFSFVDILDQEAKDFQDKRKEQLKLDEKELAKELVENKDYFFFKQKMDKLRDNTANHFFFLLKQLTLTGFFTSEIGMTKALRFVKVPGRFDGEFPYEKGEHAWAV